MKRLQYNSTIAVRERPLLMSGPMVRATLDGTKTQTRRVVTFPRAVAAIEGGVSLVAFDRMQPGYADGSTRAVFDFDGEPNAFSVRCPYGQPGDRLYVRETHLRSGEDVMYTDHTDYDVCYPTKGGAMNLWRIVPGIHMRREDSRLTLESIGVRVERVQDISRDDAIAEGIPQLAGEARALGLDVPAGHVWDNRTSVENYAFLWNCLNEKRGYGWDVNPWVWVLTFRRVEP